MKKSVTLIKLISKQQSKKKKIYISWYNPTISSSVKTKSAESL